MHRGSALCIGHPWHLAEKALHPACSIGREEALGNLHRFLDVAARCEHHRPGAPRLRIISLQQWQQHGVSLVCLTRHRQRHGITARQVIALAIAARHLVILLRAGKIAQKVECQRTVEGDRPFGHTQTDRIIEIAQCFKGIFGAHHRRTHTGNGPRITRLDAVRTGKEVERRSGIAQFQRGKARIGQRDRIGRAHGHAANSIAQLDRSRRVISGFDLRFGLFELVQHAFVCILGRNGGCQGKREREG